MRKKIFLAFCLELTLIIFTLSGCSNTYTYVKGETFGCIGYEIDYDNSKSENLQPIEATLSYNDQSFREITFKDDGTIRTSIHGIDEGLRWQVSGNKIIIGRGQSSIYNHWRYEISFVKKGNKLYYTDLWTYHVYSVTVTYEFEKV